MGTCASTQYSTDRPTLSPTAKVVDSIDGTLQEFRQPTSAGNVLSDRLDTCFLCNAETMFVNCHVPHVPADEELQLGQIYFIMPVSKSDRPISLRDICLLAIKASLAIEVSKTPSFKGRRKIRGTQKVDFQVALKMLR